MSCRRCKTAGFVVSVLVHGLLIAAVSDRLMFDPAATISTVPVTMDMFAVSAGDSSDEPVSDVVMPPEPVLPEPVAKEDVKPVQEIIEPEEPVVEKKITKPLESSKPKPKPKPKPKTKPKPKKPKPKSKTSQPVRQADKAPSPSVQAKAETVVSSVVSRQSIAQSGKIDRIRQRYTQALLAAIEANKYYPKRARRKRHEGNVTITFIINQDGSIQSVQLQESSGFASLDKAAIGVMQRIGHFDPLPVELGLSRWEFVIPISYKLL